MHGFIRWPLAVAGLLALTALPFPATAQDDKIRAPISLRNVDGSLSVSGNLVGFEDGYYLIEVQGIGVLRIDSAAVECTGDGCPYLTPEFGISGNGRVTSELIPVLLRGYGDSVGATYSAEDLPDGGRILRLTDAQDTVRAEVTLRTIAPADAFAAMSGNTADIVVTDRRMTDADAEALTAAGLADLRETEHELAFGTDATVVIVHPDNLVRNLTALEIARIYAGEVRNWSDLGGPDLPIHVNALGEGADRRDRFAASFLGPNGLEETGDTVAWRTEAELVDAVAGDAGGIGYAGRSAALDSSAKLVPLRETCGLISAPTAFRIKTDGYRLASRLYAYKRPGRIHPEAQAFLDWALSDEAQPVIREAGFIDRGIERMRLEDMGMTLIHTAAVEPDFNGNQFAGMMRDLRFADRISISFRFLPGSTTLDIDSIRNLEILAEMIRAGAFEGLEILLVGFTDSIGDRVRNTQLAARRSQVVRENLLATLPPEIGDSLNLLPLSYGELLPLSCNTDEIGRERNRRVEVWLRRPEF